jgi:hypothetical protein
MGTVSSYLEYPTEYPTEDAVMVSQSAFDKFNWTRDAFDERDVLDEHKVEYSNRPFTLRHRMPAVLDQGEFGSSTIGAICGAIQYCEEQAGLPPSPRSRLFIAYVVRNASGKINEDIKYSIRNVIQNINKHGVCLEESWPYDLSQIAACPRNQCFEIAKNQKKLIYKRVAQNMDSIKETIASGYPIVMGIKIYDSVLLPQVTKTGNVVMPTADDKELGGHCMLCCGWNDRKKSFTFMNSFGTEWGSSGFGTIPYDYVLNKDLTGDLWVITLAEK